MFTKMERTVEIPSGVSFEVSGNLLKVSGPKGAIQREFPLRSIKVEKKEGEVVVSSLEEISKNRAIVGAFESHLINMFKGVQEGFVFKLKICSSHFPMSVKVSGAELSVSNFIGGKKLNKITIPAEVQVKVSGEIIEVTSLDIEKAGNIASKIESLTRLTKKDRRIFQDGIYMIEKRGKKIQ